VLSLSMLLATPVLAQPAPDQKAAAQALFEQGRDLVEQRHFAEACPKLAESQKLDPGLGTMLWLADCLENNGQTASAWATFSEAASTAAVARDKREQIARDRVKKLAGMLSRLTIQVPQDAAAQGLVVKRDGIDVGTAEWGLPVPVDPGVHSVAASAPGRTPWTTTVQLPLGPTTQQVTVPLLETAEPVAGADDAAGPVDAAVPLDAARSVDTAQPSNAVAPAPAPESPAAATREEEAPGNTQRVLGLALGGLGLVGLGFGTYFSFHAKSTYDGAASSGHCQPNDQCDATGTQERNDAFSQATVATITLGLSAAAVVGGVVVYLLAPRAKPVAVGLAPTARGSAAWLSVRF
jgi:serine/threonine-protein kinase